MTTHAIPAGPVDTRPDGFHDVTTQTQILTDTLTAAGVELGTYERDVISWLSCWDWASVAVIASWVARAATSREPAPTIALPSRFDATPAEVDQHLRRILAEDVYLAYQQAIGARAVAEAAQDVITEGTSSLHITYGSATDYAQHFADHIDPAKNGCPYPSQLQCSQHDGFGPCPGAPTCTPRDTPKDPQ
jgi:hypothetical protein